jgi:FkbM family methyltransferase
MLTAISRKVLPAALRRLVRRSLDNETDPAVHLARARRRLSEAEPGSLMPCLDYTVRINDGPNYYSLYKDIFVRRIYHFESRQKAPRVLDCGGNVGMSVLYFKHIYPAARITAFEPDPVIFALLEENVATNGLQDVRLVQSAVSGREGNLTFHSDGKYSGYLTEQISGTAPTGWTEYRVPCVTLDRYLDEPVDFLKMNVEGAEFEALLAAEQRLRQVREMVIEYHHLPGLPRNLHALLALLHRQGFEYLLNSFDPETNPAGQPPFHIASDTRYFLLIYAKRAD